MGRWPPLLVLHLRRSFWSAQGHHAKVVGHVRFPLRLALEANDAQRVTYQLKAVVEHSGLASSTGHYVTYRSVGVDESYDSSARSSTSGTAESGAVGPPRVPLRWVRVSDESVVAVSEKDVAAAHAVMLFYEK